MFTASWIAITGILTKNCQRFDQVVHCAYRSCCCFKVPDYSPSGVSHGLEVVGIPFSPAVSASSAHGIAIATIHVLDVTRLQPSPNTSS